jgi:hypothetical protein
MCCACQSFVDADILIFKADEITSGRMRNKHEEDDEEEDWKAAT